MAGSWALPISLNAAREISSQKQVNPGACGLCAQKRLLESLGLSQDRGEMWRWVLNGYSSSRDDGQAIW